MISNYLYLISIGVAILTIIFIIYNYILLVKRKKADNKDEDKKQNIIKGLKNNLIIFTVILISCLSFVFYYSRSVDIYRIVDIGENINYKTINIYGTPINNGTNGETINLDLETGEELIDLLEKYNYKRTFEFSDTTGGEGVFITLQNTEGKYGFVEIWKNGYIRRPNYKVYKIQSEDREELYNELSNLFENM